jgi:hypothetical protein
MLFTLTAYSLLRYFMSCFIEQLLQTDKIYSCFKRIDCMDNNHIDFMFSSIHFIQILIFTSSLLFQSDDYIDHPLSYGFIDRLSYIAIEQNVLVIKAKPTHISWIYLRISK